MVKVRKRDGRIEEFIPEKLVVSMIKAGAPPDVAREIARKIEERIKDKEEVHTNELREMVLKELKERNKEWYDNWIVFDRAVKKRWLYF